MGGEKKVIAELVNDLGRRTGAAFEESVLLLLSKGRPGVGEVAQALDQSRGDDVRGILTGRAPQVVEFLAAYPGGLQTEASQRILEEIPAGALKDRGWAFMERGDLDEAVCLADLSRDREGADHEYFRLMARIWVERRDLSNAINCFEEALGLAPSEAKPAIFVDRTRAYLSLGEPEKAWESLCGATSSPMDDGTGQVVETLLGEVLWALVQRNPAKERVSSLLESLGPEEWSQRAAEAVVSQSRRAAFFRQERLFSSHKDLRESLERIALSAARGKEEGFEQSRLVEVESRALQARRLSEDFLKMVSEYTQYLKEDGEEDASDTEDEGETLSATVLGSIKADWGEHWEDTRGRLLELGEEVRHAILEAVPSTTGGQVRIDDLDRGLWKAIGFSWAIAATLEMLKPLSKGYRRLAPFVEGVLESLAAAFRMAESSPVVRLGTLPEIQMDEDKLKAALAIVTCMSAKENTGTPLGFTASVKEESGDVDISVGPAEADGKNNWSSLGDDSHSALKVALEVALSHNGDLLQKGSAFRLTMPQSSVEKSLSLVIPGYADLTPETRQALKAAEALAQEEGGTGDVKMSSFLYLKALEIEMDGRIGAYLERHKLLSKALSLSRDTSSWERVLKEAYHPVDVPQNASARLAGLLKAIEKDRIAKEIRDWNALALLLMMFSGEPALKALGHDLQGLEALKAWAGGSPAKGRPPADVEAAFRRAKEATIRGLGHLVNL